MVRYTIFILLSLFFLSSPLFAREDGFIVESIGTGTLIEPRKNLIRSILLKDTMRFGYSALKIILDTNQKEPRGKMQGRRITLSPHIQKESEFIKLLTHEVSHYVDIFFLLPSSLDQEDPSKIFYRISWEDKTTKKSTQTMASFVSGYASTNQYEDFAESLTFYIFHNDEFHERAMKNDSLRNKYLFISNFVFKNYEFQDTDFTIGKIPSYLWDTTKIPVSVKKYLYSLN